MASSQGWQLMLAVGWELSWAVINWSHEPCPLHVAWPSYSMVAEFQESAFQGLAFQEIKPGAAKLPMTWPQKSHSVTSATFYWLHKASLELV